jgi:hypothetical protein
MPVWHGFWPEESILDTAHPDEGGNKLDRPITNIDPCGQSQHSDDCLSGVILFE